LTIKTFAKKVVVVLFATSCGPLLVGCQSNAVSNSSQPGGYQFSGYTVLFNSERPGESSLQVEYLDPDGTASVWTSDHGGEVLKIRWRVHSDKLCWIIPPRVLVKSVDKTVVACSPVSSVLSNVKDSRKGDVYNLLGKSRQPVSLPSDVKSLEDVDKILAGEN